MWKMYEQNPRLQWKLYDSQTQTLWFNLKVSWVQKNKSVSKNHWMCDARRKDKNKYIEHESIEHLCTLFVSICVFSFDCGKVMLNFICYSPEKKIRHITDLKPNSINNNKESLVIFTVRK